MHESWHTTLFSIFYCVEVVRNENHSHMQKLRVKLRLYGFLSFFASFARKVNQTWFLLHETWHTTLFSIYYSIEVVIKKLYSYARNYELSCDFMGFYAFLALSRIK